MRKVAIIGTAPASRAVAPFADPEWEIWVCSQGNQGNVPRVTKWFELHAVQALLAPDCHFPAGPYFAWLRSQTFPVYMQERNEHVPGAVVFPYKQMVEMFGRNWFTSSVAWMMAYAIHQMQPGDQLGLFGVDMAAGEEHYSQQRAGCVRFIEIARDRGITVTIPYESCLGQPPALYGYYEATRMGRKLESRKAELAQQRAAIAAQIDRLTRELAYFDGAIEQNNYMLRTFCDGMDAELDLEPPPSVDVGTARVPTTADFEPAVSGLFLPRNRLNGGATHEEA